MSKLAFRAQTVDIAYLPLRQDFLAKNVLMTARRDFGNRHYHLTDFSAFNNSEMRISTSFVIRSYALLRGGLKMVSY